MKRILKCILGVVLLVGLAFPCQAEEAAPLWTSSIGLTYLATNGNTDTQSLGFDLKLERKPTPWGVDIVASANQTEEDDVTTAERYFAGVRAKRSIAERWDLFAGLSGEQNEFAGLDLMIFTEAGGIYKALLGPVHTLSFDLGLTWTDEDHVNLTANVNYFGAVAGLTYAWKISDTATLSERLIYYPNFDESDDWRLSSDTALTATLTDKLALLVGYEVRYRHLPIDDNASTDTTTKVSLVITF